jgi:hypothetical protein
VTAPSSPFRVYSISTISSCFGASFQMFFAHPALVIVLAISCAFAERVRRRVSTGVVPAKLSDFLNVVTESSTHEKSWQALINGICVAEPGRPRRICCRTAGALRLALKAKQGGLRHNSYI